MCLQKKHKWPRIALKNIVVYKILAKDKNTGNWCTPYRYNYVDPGHTTLKASISPLNGIRKSSIGLEGVHSYSDKEHAIMVAAFISCKVFKAIIPIGSLYYVGKENDLASSKLFVTDEIIEL